MFLWQNPTMKTWAIAMHASEYRAGEMKQGNIG
jgi:hypothetical protein